MAKACPKPRCPARADVYDWNTTEYRKGCRRTQCQKAHTLAEQRRKARKVEAAAAEPVQDAAEPAHTAAEPAETPDLLTKITADLEKLASDHPLAGSLTGIALSLANEVQVRSRVPTLSSAPAAKQLIEVLERLLPTKGSDDELEKLLQQLADNDDEATADEAAAG